MSKLDDVLKLAKKQNYTILLDKDGSRKFCVVPVDKEHIPDMTQRLEDQLKEEGKLGYYVGMIMPVSWEPCMDFLPIYGRTDKYETKWLRRYIEDAVADELKDRGSELYKRILAYEPNVVTIKSKTESIRKLHIKESISGRIEDTNERCIMEPTGYWIGAKGKHITSYERVDKDIEYDKNGNPVKRQYSMDKQHRFWVETEDRI